MGPTGDTFLMICGSLEKSLKKKKIPAPTARPNGLRTIAVN